jgi:hypothetical protein
MSWQYVYSTNKRVAQGMGYSPYTASSTATIYRQRPIVLRLFTVNGTFEEEGGGIDGKLG